MSIPFCEFSLQELCPYPGRALPCNPPETLSLDSGQGSALTIRQGRCPCTLLGLCPRPRQGRISLATQLTGLLCTKGIVCLRSLAHKGMVTGQYPPFGTRYIAKLLRLPIRRICDIIISALIIAREAPMNRTTKTIHTVVSVVIWLAVIANAAWFAVSYHSLPGQIGCHFGPDGEFEVIAERFYGAYRYAVCCVIFGDC